MTEQSQLGLTPSATVGPYFAYRMADTARYGTHDLAGGNLITPDAAGERVRILGHVHDGAGAPVNDAFIEIWQADAHGRYAHLAAGEKPNSSFKGFGRAGARNGGAFAFETIKPGLVPGPGGRMQAPHLNVTIFTRGLASSSRPDFENCWRGFSLFGWICFNGRSGMLPS